MRSVAAKHGGKSRVREETDLFDYILEHLVAEGYADTNKAALAIMANMSEEWRESIVEKHATFGYNAEDPLDDFEQFVDKGPKTNKQKRNAIELNNKILSKPGMPVKGV
jgi:predicted secreted acid phosphatase